jgi:hypothetical protein
MAALGSIPWVGGLIGATAAYSAERDQDRVNELQRQWMEEHAKRFHDLGAALTDILARLETFGKDAADRVETEEYLALVRKGFGIWDRADTNEKRTLVKTLLTNAAGTSLCPDDLVRLFLEWIERYHETHFMVIREVFRSPGVTRAGVWTKLRGDRPRDDSADADLFRLLVDDLSQGRIIRQHRETTPDGQFIARRSTQRRARGVLKSAFDDVDTYELTELGKQFVHYAMNEVVPRLGASDRI